jgi:hypothetical protein
MTRSTVETRGLRKPALGTVTVLAHCRFTLRSKGVAAHVLGMARQPALSSSRTLVTAANGTTMRRPFNAALISLLLGCCTPAFADLIGTDILFECRECTPSTADHFVAVAGPSDYLLQGDGYAWNEIDVEASTVTIKSLIGGYTRSPLFFRLTWSPQQYHLASVSVAPASSFEPGYSWRSGELIVDMGAWDFAAGDHVTFNLTAAPVPEPAQWLLAVFGTVVVACRHRRHARA